MLSDLLFRLRSVFRRERVEAELDDELQFHLAKAAERNRARGLDEQSALRQARLALGGPEQAKENCRDARGISFWENTLADLKYGLRQLKSHPVFTAAVVLVLALAIGVNTAIFSLCQDVLLKAIPVSNPNSLVIFGWKAKHEPERWNYGSFEKCFVDSDSHGHGYCSFSMPVYQNFQKLDSSFTGVTAFAGTSRFSLTGAGRARMVAGELVAGNFFDVSGLKAIIGRPLSMADDRPGAPAVAVLSYGQWRDEFGGAASVLGQVVHLNSVPFTVVGVLDRNSSHFSPGKVYDVWVPLSSAPDLKLGFVPKNEDGWWLTVAGRLPLGVSLAQAQAAANASFRNAVVEQTHLLKADAEPEVALAPVNRGLIGVRFFLQLPLLILAAAVGLVLLIACANVAGLLTARSVSRRREVVVRMSLGAVRSRIMRQLLTESVLLALAGALLGLFIANFGARYLARFLMLDFPVSISLEPANNATVLLFTLGLTVLSTILFGVAPALSVTRHDGGRADSNSAFGQAVSKSHRSSRLRKALVVLQVALSIVMLLSAGLFLRTLRNLQTEETGFQTDNLVLFAVDTGLKNYEDAKAFRFSENVRRRMASMPGVDSVGYAADSLLNGSSRSNDLRLVGSQSKSGLSTLPIGPDFFATLRIPVLAGRAFSLPELKGNAAVAVVNSAFVKAYTNGRSPIGLSLEEYASKPVKNYLIVGVVGDAKYTDMRETVRPNVYLPYQGSGFVHFLVRTKGDPASVLARVMKTVAAEDPDLPVTELRTQREQIGMGLFGERLLARLSAVLGLLALLITAVGLYGLLSFEVSRRTREIGVRIALGALPRVVTGSIVREALAMSVVGLVIGLPVALLLSQAFQSLLFGLAPTDWQTAAGACLVLLTVVIAAGFIPASRAARVNPTEALRHE